MKFNLPEEELIARYTAIKSDESKTALNTELDQKNSANWQKMTLDALRHFWTNSSALLDELRTLQTEAMTLRPVHRHKTTVEDSTWHVYTDLEMKSYYHLTSPEVRQARTHLSKSQYDIFCEFVIDLTHRIKALLPNIIALKSVVETAEAAEAIKLEEDRIAALKLAEEKKAAEAIESANRPNYSSHMLKFISDEYTAKRGFLFFGRTGKDSKTLLQKIETNQFTASKEKDALIKNAVAGNRLLSILRYGEAVIDQTKQAWLNDQTITDICDTYTTQRGATFFPGRITSEETKVVLAFLKNKENTIEEKQWVIAYHLRNKNAGRLYSILKNKVGETLEVRAKNTATA